MSLRRLVSQPKRTHRLVMPSTLFGMWMRM